MELFKEADLLLFIDETGDESCNDQNNPVFGFGGIIVRSKEEYNSLCQDWKQLRKVLGIVGPFHASNLRDFNEKSGPSQQQINAINNFVKKDFFLFHSLKDKESLIYGEEEDKKKLYKVLLESVLFRNEKIPLSKKSRVIFESSPRDKEIERLFLDEGWIQSEGIVGISFKNKDDMIPGLEIADLIVHTSSRGLRNYEVGRAYPPDYENTFQKKSEFSHGRLIHTAFPLSALLNGKLLRS